jgi:hypothetical protein
MSEVKKSGILSTYISDYWNVFDWITYIMIIVTAIIHIDWASKAGRNVDLDEQHAR